MANIRKPTINDQVKHLKDQLLLAFESKTQKALMEARERARAKTEARSALSEFGLTEADVFGAADNKAESAQTEPTVPRQQENAKVVMLEDWLGRVGDKFLTKTAYDTLFKNFLVEYDQRAPKKFLEGRLHLPPDKILLLLNDKSKELNGIKVRKFLMAYHAGNMLRLANGLNKSDAELARLEQQAGAARAIASNPGFQVQPLDKKHEQSLIDRLDAYKTKIGNFKLQLNTKLETIAGNIFAEAAKDYKEADYETAHSLKKITTITVTRLSAKITQAAQTASDITMGKLSGSDEFKQISNQDKFDKLSSLRGELQTFHSNETRRLAKLKKTVETQFEVKYEGLLAVPTIQLLDWKEEEKEAKTTFDKFNQDQADQLVKSTEQIAALNKLKTALAQGGDAKEIGQTVLAIKSVRDELIKADAKKAVLSPSAKAKKEADDTADIQGSGWGNVKTALNDLHSAFVPSENSLTLAHFQKTIDDAIQAEQAVITAINKKRQSLERDVTVFQELRSKQQEIDAQKAEIENAKKKLADQKKARLDAIMRCQQQLNALSAQIVTIETMHISPLRIGLQPVPLAGTERQPSPQRAKSPLRRPESPPKNEEKDNAEFKVRQNEAKDALWFLWDEYHRKPAARIPVSPRNRPQEAPEVELSELKATRPQGNPWGRAKAITGGTAGIAIGCAAGTAGGFYVAGATGTGLLGGLSSGAALLGVSAVVGLAVTGALLIIAGLALVGLGIWYGRKKYREYKQAEAAEAQAQKRQTENTPLLNNEHKEQLSEQKTPSRRPSNAEKLPTQLESALAEQAAHLADMGVPPQTRKFISDNQLFCNESRTINDRICYRLRGNFYLTLPNEDLQNDDSRGTCLDEYTELGAGTIARQPISTIAEATNRLKPPIPGSSKGIKVAIEDKGAELLTNYKGKYNISSERMTDIRGLNLDPTSFTEDEKSGRLYVLGNIFVDEKGQFHYAPSTINLPTGVFSHHYSPPKALAIEQIRTDAVFQKLQNEKARLEWLKTLEAKVPNKQALSCVRNNTHIQPPVIRKNMDIKDGQCTYTHVRDNLYMLLQGNDNDQTKRFIMWDGKKITGRLDNLDDYEPQTDARVLSSHRTQSAAIAVRPRTEQQQQPENRGTGLSRSQDGKR